MFDNIRVMVDALTSDPINFLIILLYTIVVILTSLILHEYAHGRVALACGDPTAKLLGRLSLNPLRHLDPLGTVCMFVAGFGWAKPVPVNPANYRKGRRDDFFVAIAGIVTNLTLFFICIVAAVLLNQLIWTEEFMQDATRVMGSQEFLLNPYYDRVLVSGDANYLSASVIYSEGHNLIGPFTDMMRMPWLIWIQRFLLMMSQVNLALAVFNFLPIPPLDGFHLLNDTLLKGKLQLNQRMFQIAYFILLALCFTGILDKLLSFLNSNVYSAVVRFLLMIFG